MSRKVETRIAFYPFFPLICRWWRDFLCKFTVVNRGSFLAGNHLRQIVPNSGRLALRLGFLYKKENRTCRRQRLRHAVTEPGIFQSAWNRCASQTRARWIYAGYPHSGSNPRRCFHPPFSAQGFPSGAGGAEPTCHCRRCGRYRFSLCVGKIPLRRAWQPTPGFLPGGSCGERSLAG